MNIKLIIIPILMLNCISAYSFSDYWNINQNSIENNIYEVSEFDIKPEKHLLASFNLQLFQQHNTMEAEKSIVLPMPNGEFEKFTIYQVNIMSEKLAIKFPKITTYRGYSHSETPKSLVMDITQKGLHAVIKSDHGEIWIDPVNRSTNISHMSYYRTDVPSQDKGFRCEIEGHNHNIENNSHAQAQGGSLPLNEGSLKTYRLAIAATAEYTDFHSSPDDANVADGLAAIVTAMNRVNGIYEKEVGIRMILIDNNDQLVFTDTATDGYSNNNGSAMLNQNQTKINSVIGIANYDIGHVFSTGGGGIAQLRVPCKDGAKAKGVTGLDSPVNDLFYVDYVAHELGHQWGANHIFNSTSGGCGGGNRSGTAAVEPGSGSTIMGYAGLCGSNNLQSRSHSYFNSYSLGEIIAYSGDSTGSTCSVIVDTDNSAPIVDAGDDFTIPKLTPFTLCADASDDNDISMNYNWEQNDTGPSGNANTPSGNAPTFRSFVSSSLNCRTFPRLSNILANSLSTGERMPSYARSMNFRATVRDNQPDGGAINTDDMRITVTDDGPFQITTHTQNTGIVTGIANQISWDVAGTDVSPINCSSVDIDFSTNGGTVFSDMTPNLPNTGSAMVMVPETDSTQIRYRITCSDNIFFDINDANLSHVDDQIFDNSFE